MIFLDATCARIACKGKIYSLQYTAVCGSCIDDLCMHDM